jgi:hypothetical protein
MPLTGIAEMQKHRLCELPCDNSDTAIGRVHGLKLAIGCTIAYANNVKASTRHISMHISGKQRFSYLIR